MKKIIKFLSLFLSFSLLLGSCKSSSYKASVFIYDLTDTFLIELGDLLYKRFDEENINFKIFGAERNQMEQNRQVVDEIQSGSQLLILNLVDRLSAPAIMEKAEQTKTPVIFFNREPFPEDMKEALKAFNDFYYVGTNASYEGTVQANMAAALLGSPNSLSPTFDKNQDGKIQTVLIKGELGHQDTEYRSEKCLGHLKELGYDVDLLATRYGNWSRSTAKQEMQEVLKEQGDKVELVFCNNDDMALGCIDALKEENKIQDGKMPFPIFGVDGTKVGLEAIENGTMAGTVRNHAKNQAYAIATLAEKILHKEDIDLSSFGFDYNDYHCLYPAGEPIVSTNIKFIGTSSDSVDNSSSEK
ncbi:MAG: galactose ABC transporter substrate-binding protein [Eubacteriales bacterium]|nr:galactose ABC transporter substrate-binding protein [Eubacteriales bacterium]